MEAKIFLKVVIDFIGGMYKTPNPSTYHDQQHERNKMIDKIKSLSEFYSKPFSQDMIEGLFRYWRKSEFNNDYESMNDNCIYFVRDSHYSIRADKNNPATGVSLLLPKTLDDFISDCGRAGMTFIWREEIVKKYFS